MSLSGNGDSTVEKKVRLFFHRYRYFPYEKELAKREVQRFAPDCRIDQSANGLIITGPVDVKRLRGLTYVSAITANGATLRTTQHDLEASVSRRTGSPSRQSTRYSAHALHEYKGRFNPQVVGFLLNYLGADLGSRIFDPFCGSGTTLIESAIHGIEAVGVDINPLAAFITNAKLFALATPADEIHTALIKVIGSFGDSLKYEQIVLLEPDDRQNYLAAWFTPEVLATLEALRKSITEYAGDAKQILLALVSDLLRDYSLQEPSDLRIRRRISPMPTRPLIEAFEIKAKKFVKTLAASQEAVGLVESNSEAFVGDSKNPRAVIDYLSGTRADFVITSPPYATALPYIDTQRLSLVWLELCSVADIRRLEGDAVGSRERRAAEPDWQKRIVENSDALPASVAGLCCELSQAISGEDGFRRRATPGLVYRYFADMKKAFLTLSEVVKKQGRLAFVVGSNHTTLGGHRFEIETPILLTAIATQLGFRVVDQIGLQTYQRYELHRKNSIRCENLTIFERG